MPYSLAMSVPVHRIPYPMAKLLALEASAAVRHVRSCGMKR